MDFIDDKSEQTIERLRDIIEITAAAAVFFYKTWEDLQNQQKAIDAGRDPDPDNDETGSLWFGDLAEEHETGRFHLTHLGRRVYSIGHQITKERDARAKDHDPGK